jgi:transcriptional regulator with XRE-family HTH domain
MTSAASSVIDSGRSRKNESTILQALAKVGQNEVARRMQVSDSTVSRFKNGELLQWASFLAALGLKVIPEGMKCYDAKKLDAILELARAHLVSMETTEQLAWEDAE